MYNDEERKQGYNIATEITDDNYISTAAISASCPHMGYYIQFETIIWGWNGKKRTGIKHHIIHINEKEAKKVHKYITGNVRK